MRNNLFIVKFTDAEVNENCEMEFTSFDHAKQAYFDFKKQEGIENLHILEYSFFEKEYHLVTI